MANGHGLRRLAVTRGVFVVFVVLLVFYAGLTWGQPIYAGRRFWESASGFVQTTPTNWPVYLVASIAVLAALILAYQAVRVGWSWAWLSGALLVSAIGTFTNGYPGILMAVLGLVSLVVAMWK